MSGTTGNIHVLLVDDDPDFAEVAAEFIERYDEQFDVETAISASDGIDRLAQDKVDCVVSDFDMPGQDGIDFLEAVREEYPDLPFILYTGKGSEEVASEAISSGVSDYLQKETGTSQYEVLANRIENAVAQYRAEREAATTQRRLRELSETTDDILWMVAGDWSEFLFVNSAYEDIWGRSREVLLENPMDFMEGVHPEDHDLVTKSMTRASNGNSVDYEFRVNADEDFRRWVWVQAEPIFDETGETARIAGFVRDITDRNEYEQELERHQAYLENVGDAISVIDADGIIRYESPAIADVLGYEPGERVGDNGFEYIHPDDRETAIEHFQQSHDSGANTGPVELRLRHKDGSWRWIDSRASYHLDDPAIEAVVASLRDVTERKRRENELEKLREQTEFALEETDTVVWTWNPDSGEATTLYRDIEDLIEFDASRVEGLEEFVSHVVHPEDRSYLMDTYEQVVRGESDRLNVEFRTHPDLGRERWFVATAYLRTAGDIRQLVGLMADITDRKRKEWELDRSQDLLGHTEQVADIGGWEADVETGDVRWTEGTYGIHDLPPDPDFDPRLDSAMEFYHPDDQDEIERLVERCIESSEPYDVELRLRTAEDRLRWVRTTGEAIRKDGDIVTLRGAIQDITDRKEREQELERHAALFDHSSDAIVLIDYRKDTPVIRAANEAFQSLFAPGEADITGRDIDAVVASGDRVEEARAISKRVRKGELVQKQLTRETVDGVRTFDWQVVPIEDRETGEIETAFGIYTDITERLRREERFQAFVEQSTDIVSVLTAEGIYEYQSPSVEPILGYDPEAMIGENAFEYVHPDDRAAVIETFERAVADPNATPKVEFRYRHADGSWRWLESRGKNQLENPAVDGVVLNSRDITERKSREQELERYKAYLEQARDIVTVVNADGTVEFQSDSAENTTGYSPEDVMGQDGFEYVHPEDREKVTSLFSSFVTESETEASAELRVETTDGSWRWIEARGVNKLDDPLIDGIITSSRDITRRKEHELELERQTEELEDLTSQLEEQYRYLFEEAPVMAVVTRAENGGPIIEDCNQLFVDTLGYEKADVIGEPLATMYTPESRRKLLDHDGYERALTGEFVREDRDFVTAEGNTIETLLRAVPRQDVGDETGGTLALYIDVSERKELKREKDRLEEFTGIVSHDLRNPLQVAESRTELAADECDSDHLDGIRDAHERMGELIEDLLQYARSGDSIDEMTAVDVASLSEDCWEGNVFSDATFRIDVSRVIRADRSSLQQLLENIYRNAIEHGGEDVTVTVGELDSGFFIADDGPGIPPDERDDVFDAGYSTNEGGTGFGLSIVKEIVEAHNWNIRVTESAEGGARFEITGVESAAE